MTKRNTTPADGEMKAYGTTRAFIFARNVTPGMVLLFGNAPAAEVVEVSPRSGGRLRIDVKHANGSIQGGTFRKTQKLGYQQ